MKKHFDLFTGIAGFTIAAGWAGFETIGFSEIEPYPCKLLKQNYPNIKNYGGITKINGKDIIEEHGAIELITGGFPCQPFSAAGKRKGKGDDRHLWPEMLRVIQEIKPRWVLGENVAGIIEMELENCLLDLERGGYEVAPPLVIPSCSVEGPSQRKRVWIIAHAESYKGDDCPSRSAREIHRPAGVSLESRGCYMPIPNEAWDLNSRDMVESAICREDDGIRDRAHRINALGNAIDPRVAYEILRLM